MKTKLLLAATVAAIFPTSAMAQRAAPAAIVVVDTDRVLRECTACVSATAALQAQQAAFQQRQQTAGQELQTLQQTFESTRMHVSVQLNQALDPIFTAVMTARGANIVLSTDARLAHAPALDVTGDVLAQLNRSTPSVSVTPMPQQAPATVAPVPPATPRPGGR